MSATEPFKGAGLELVIFCNLTAAQLTAEDRVFQPNEIVVESDTKKVKLGDGATTWTSLGYLNPGGAVDDTAYNATSWDAVTGIAPSKNAVRDQIETMLTSIALKAPLASPTFTGTVTLPAAVVTALPTADPHVVGHLWANSGAVTVSAG